MAGLAKLLSTLVACATLASPSVAQAPTGAQGEHQERAQRWLERHEYELPESPSFDKLLAQTHTRIDLGIFEVYVTPDVLADSRWMPEIQNSLAGLLELQGTWVDWVQSGDQDDKQIKANQKVLSKWIEGLGKKRFNATSELSGASLIEVLGAKDKERSASAQFASFMRSGGTLGNPSLVATAEASMDTEASVGTSIEYPPARLVLAPSRKDFVELTALLGLIEKDQQPYFWVPGTEIWTHIDHHGARIVGLEFSDGSNNYEASVAMTHKNPGALAQHVVQLGSYALLDSYFGEKMEPMIAGGLASEMVISIYDEADTRIDGDLRSRSSAAVSVFVPGGNPDGGLLPPSNANSRWRDGQGKGYFVSLLKKSQQSGRSAAKQSWQKLTGFELRSDQGAPMIFQAPILGGGALPQPDEPYRGDYLEFLRAYRTAFLHWLVNEAEGSKKASRLKFSEFMNALSASDDPSLAELFERTYGVPLSANTGEHLFPKKHQPLEGRFLTWLSKQR